MKDHELKHWSKEIVEKEIGGFINVLPKFLIQKWIETIKIAYLKGKERESQKGK